MEGKEGWRERGKGEVRREGRKEGGMKGGMKGGRKGTEKENEGNPGPLHGGVPGTVWFSKVKTQTLEPGDRSVPVRNRGEP